MNFNTRAVSSSILSTHENLLTRKIGSICFDTCEKLTNVSTLPDAQIGVTDGQLITGSRINSGPQLQSSNWARNLLTVNPRVSKSDGFLSVGTL